MNVDAFTDAMGLIDSKYIQEAVSYQRPKSRPAHTWLFRAACIFLALLLCGSLLLVLNPEIRAQFNGWVRGLLDGRDTYSFVGEVDESELTAYELGWIPDSWTLLDSQADPHGESFVYIDENDRIGCFFYENGAVSGATTVGDPDSLKKTVFVNGLPATMYFTEDGSSSNTIVWSSKSGSILFIISGDLDEETLIQLAESVRPKE